MGRLPRILVVNGAVPDPGEALPIPGGAELVGVADLAEAITRARAEPGTAILTDPDSVTCMCEAGSGRWAEQILSRLYSGIAVLDPDLKVTWANPSLRDWCESDPIGRPFAEALGGPEVRGPDPAPFRTAQLTGQSVTTHLVQGPGRHLSVQINPCPGPANEGCRFAVLCRDVTGEVVRQQKLDALYSAGSELGGLGTEQLSEMDINARIELLKQNLRRCVHELLHYDVIEIRLLNHLTGQLTPLLEEGMTPEAATRVLYARPEGNGVTGYVAATGESYLCRDTASDPRYLPGAPGARSSLTVPLVAEGEVIGTLNVENPSPNAFSEEDLRFTELFASQVAQALHTLQLLSAQQSCTASQSIEAVNREIALPADDVLTAVSALIARSTDADPEANELLHRILGGARAIKRSIQRVGTDLAPTPPTKTVKGHDTEKLRNQRVLVVDHDELTRRSAHAMLDRFGCLVDTAAAGLQGEALARTGTYDAILADIRLPDLGGYETYRRLKAAQPEARMILVTEFGYDSAHSIVKARQEGLRFVLLKPLRLEPLLDALLAPLPRSDAQPHVIQAS